MSIYGILNTGRSGMMAHSAATGVTAQNASNAGTVGYTRRRARLENVAPPEGGVRSLGPMRINDPFVETRMLGAGSEAGYGDAKSFALGALDVIFADGPGDIGEALGAFEGSLIELSAYPDENGSRVGVLSTADSLAQAFSRASTALTFARAEANDRIVAEVDSINASATRIAELGAEISRAEIGGREASDLRDLRDQELTRLAERAPIRVIEGKNGGINVLLASSVSLVDEDNTAHMLSAQTDPGSGDVAIWRTEAGVERNVTSLFTSGRVGGIVDARDGGLATSRTALDELAFELGNAYNAAHAGGFALDGTGGRNLFDVGASATGAAARFSVSVDVAGSPSLIAAAGAPGGAGDNVAALAMVDLASTDIAGGGSTTAVGAYSNLVAQAGSSVRAASDGAETAAAGLAQVAALRDSVSGVSSDDEMVTLMELQRGYQATLKVVQTADEMLEALINLKR